jgi:hypothetical protein
MNVTPESTTWRSRAMPPSWSGYSPHTWSPVRRMAPNPIRPTVSSPPIVIVPGVEDVLADIAMPQSVGTSRETGRLSISPRICPSGLSGVNRTPWQLGCRGVASAVPARSRTRLCTSGA